MLYKQHPPHCERLGTCSYFILETADSWQMTLTAVTEEKKGLRNPPPTLSFLNLPSTHPLPIPITPAQLLPSESHPALSLCPASLFRQLFPFPLYLCKPCQSFRAHIKSTSSFKTCLSFPAWKFTFPPLMLLPCVEI